jgi:hypothetical protein
LGETEHEKRQKHTQRKSWDWMEYTLLMGNVSTELFQHIYFMYKYKEVKAGKSSRYGISKGYL